ncbi:sensor domain-containing diguanylate cyclase [Neobacillus vireti]|uniref:Diguanylate cyclase/phosphodiesterase n=1 Tax=Neobacillus vireti LMG 21834 TaxID=1131730 RepID=A0AB94IQ20_9BACI|nr:GGDEF domain-containing protein [Neobacillus vireti]ETI69175.1 diguanylate cyclase/phosphodiesterase [Neobacillus vireti LMG 21834]
MYVFHYYYLVIIFILLVVAFLLGRYFKKKTDKLQTALQATNEQLSSIFTYTSDAINITTVDGVLTYINPAFEQMYGWKKAELIGKPLPIIPAALHGEEQRVRDLLLTGNSVNHWEGSFLRKDGSFLDVEVTVSPLRDAAGTVNGFAAITRDISEKKQYEQKLIELAFYDPLTGAANRRSFYLRLAAAMETAKEENLRFALLYLDCDRFKCVNDSMGHDVGDELLKQFVARIQAILPASATLFRLGGDEFAIIYERPSSDAEITSLADRLLAALRENWLIQGHSFETTCSIGISLFPQDGVSQTALISAADHALYEAKDGGRNLYRFYTND